MKPLSLLLLLAMEPAHAQLVNGSFEDLNGFSLAGWEWTCGDPAGGNDVPAGTGLWCVSTIVGNMDCSPSYLYQRIPFAIGGEHWILGGWIRTDGWDALAHMGFGSLNSGTFTTQSWIGNQAPDWSYCWINDTVHATATDTAVVVLTAGEGFIGHGWFDGIELAPADPTGIPDPQPHLHVFLDAEQTLHVAVTGHVPQDVQLFDEAGRELHMQARITNGIIAIGMSDLHAGLYFLRLLTADGAVSDRFIKP